MTTSINNAPSFKGLTLIQHYAGKQTQQVIQSELKADNHIWRVASAFAPKSGIILPLQESQSTILLNVIKSVIGKDFKVPNKAQKWISNIDGKHIVFSTVEPNKNIGKNDIASIFKLDLDA